MVLTKSRFPNFWFEFVFTVYGEIILNESDVTLSM